MIKTTKRKKVIHCNLSEVYTSVAFCPNIAVIIHAPKSCSHIVHNAWLNSKRRMLLRYKGIVPNVEDNLFMTCMTDKEAIFGGEKLLEHSIEIVFREKNPECIIVISGCAASVIGDDVQSVCDKLERKYNIPIVFIPGSGFMSNQAKDGLLLSMQYLYDKFVDKTRQVKDAQLALVLGLNRFQLLEWEYLELKRIYEYFGYKKLLIPPCGMTIGELSEIGKVSLIGVYAPTAEKLKEYNKFTNRLAKNLVVPDIEERIPLSITETFTYLNAVGKLLGKEELAEKAIVEERNFLNNILEKYKPHFNGQDCVVALGHPLRFTNFKELIFILRSVGFNVNKVLLLNDLTDAEIKEYQEHISLVAPELQVSQENVWNVNDDKNDIFITSIYNEKFERQFCFRRKRIGIGGINIFLSKLSEMVLNNRSLGHE